MATCGGSVASAEISLELRGAGINEDGDGYVTVSNYMGVVEAQMPQNTWVLEQGISQLAKDWVMWVATTEEFLEWNERFKWLQGPICSQGAPKKLERGVRIQRWGHDMAVLSDSHLNNLSEALRNQVRYQHLAVRHRTVTKGCCL